jgi:outer membrane lipoprotein SlyB
MDQPKDPQHDREADSRRGDDGETHASTTGAVAAGTVTGGVIGLTGGPIGAAIGAVGGAIIGAAAERMMHGDDSAERASAEADHDQHDANQPIDDQTEEPMTDSESGDRAESA